MNRKSSFLISISERNENADNRVYEGLSESYEMVIGNYKLSINYLKNAVFAKSENENIIILFAGNIYQDDLHQSTSVGQYLIKNYLLLDKDFVKHLNGSFCLFFARKDKGEIYFATDRLNTRKIFCYKKNSKLQFATDINNLPLKECKLSYAGLASYLINGAVYNDLTLFEEIKKLESASLHKVNDLKIISDKYRNYIFTNEYENKSEKELSDELNRLYVQAIKRRVAGKKNIFISLSGGHDSRGIAAMLMENVNNGVNIFGFSHNFGENIENTDSDIARQVAENLNIPFKLYNSYDGDVLHTLRYNAEYGQGIAHFCIESDGWEKINKDFENRESSLLLVGDMNDGTFTEFHGNNKRALERTQINESIYLRDYKNYFSPHAFQNLSESWDTEYNKILDKVSQQENMINLLDYLYIDQRIPNVNSVARECYQMPFIETTTPYYDNDVLDFMQKLPPDLRNNKKLHRITLETNYSEIFKINFATKGWGNEVNWVDEINSNSKDINNTIENSKSLLDDIISPKNIIDSILALRNTSGKNKSKSILKSVHKTAKRFIPSYHKIIENLPGGEELTRKAGKYVNPRISHVLPKILILRLFLNSK